MNPIGYLLEPVYYVIGDECNAYHYQVSGEATQFLTTLVPEIPKGAVVNLTFNFIDQRVRVHYSDLRTPFTTLKLHTNIGT